MYLTIAIILIALLVVIFFVSFYLYKKTPVPKGCENIKIDENICANCSNSECFIKERMNEKEEK